MKRSILGIILMIALSVCGLPAIAFAETTLDTQPTQQQPTQANAGNTLLIDNNHIYDGMDKPYKSGYMPSAANGIATIILPLTSAQELQGNAMQVSYDLGDPSTSPFQFGNYDQTVTLGKHKTD